MPRDAGAVVVAAGQGSRFGGDLRKQYQLLEDVPVLLHALRPFTMHPDIVCTAVVLPADDAANPPIWLADLQGDALRLVAGGATRRESVASGLAALPAACTVVLVHDGARPFAPRDAIDGGLSAARAGHGAVPALPVSDTLKRADDFGTVLCTVARQGLWRAQTPQAFPRALLERAHATDAGLGPATDDAMLVEQAGGRVDLIPGDQRNIKITTPDDLEMARWWLSRATHPTGRGS